MKGQDDKTGRPGTGGQQQQKQGGNKQGQNAPREDTRRTLSDQSGATHTRPTTGDR